MRSTEISGDGGLRRRMTSIAAVLLACLAVGCSKEAPEAAPEAGRPIEARIETIASVRLPVYAVFPGSVVSSDRVEVSSRLSGYVRKLAVHEGEKVTKGQFLFAVDPTGVKAQIRRAQAGLAKAKAALAGARENYERYQNLYRQQAATKERFQEMETAYHVAQGEYQAAEAALAAASTQIKYAEVRSPFDGLVVARPVDDGQLVAPGVPVLVLEDPVHLQVKAQISEPAFVHLALGQSIRVDFEGPEGGLRTVTGTVDRLVAAADPATHTHLVKIGLPEDEGLFSGQYTSVNVQVGDQPGIVVPSGAIYTRAGITGVFVVDDQDRARFRMVTPGRRMAQGTVILSGLFPGDRLITAASGPLANGVRIRERAEGRS